MIMKLLISAVCLLLAVLPQVVSSHHSAAVRFDREKFVAISGTIIDVQWANPHTRIILDGDDGQVWTIEGIGRTYLEQRGIDRELFAVGNIVTLAGLASRFGLPEMFMGNMLLGDGRELLLAGGAKPYWTHQDDAGEPDSAAGRSYEHQSE